MKPTRSNVPVKSQPKKNTLSEIQRLQREREERRKATDQARLNRAADEQRNIDNGTPGDVDFQRMIANFRSNAPGEKPHAAPGARKICICVRKRPVSAKEIEKKDYDSVTCMNPVINVHYCKLKVDGISKFLENNPFQMDHVFGEHDTTDDLYYYSVQPLIEFVIGGGRATVFAYGQTGSGKTYTMMGVQRFVADDLFYGLAAAAEEAEATNSVIKSIEVYVTFFEIYGGRCQDLLNERNKLVIREDGNGEVNIAELLEVKVDSAEEMLRVIESGNTNRTTHATESNEVSSRSHAICQILLRKVDAKGRSKMLGKLSLIDLAGSERGADTKSHNRTRRMEGAEINKSLLALKECVRALDSNSSHVPYRASKLTLVLKDSFTKNQSRTVMIVNVSPAASSADHTLNTLRYADRIKETQVGDRKEKIYEEASVPPAPHSRESRDRSASPKVAAPNVNNKLNLQPPLRSAAAANARAGIAGMNIGKSPPVPNSNNQVTPPSVPNRPYEEDDGYMDNEEAFEFGETADEKELNKTIQSLFDEEEELLNLHMNNIQENAELLTEEGKLLQQLQADDNNDIDIYTQRLDSILSRKLKLINTLQDKLSIFKLHLQEEERASKRVADSKNRK